MKIIYLISSLILVSLSACDVNVSTQSKENSNKVVDNNYSVSTQVSSSNSDGVKITHIKEVISNSDNISINQISVNGNNSSVINGNISFNGNNIIVNGKSINSKNTENDLKEIDINLTGKLVKLAIKKPTHINSIFSLVSQTCSDDGKNYIMIDESLQPYLKDIDNGTIHLKNGNYAIHGEIKANLLTQPLNSLEISGTTKLDLNCIDSNQFSLENSGSTDVNFLNLNTEELHLNQSGNGTTIINGKHVKKLIISNSGIGVIKSTLPIDILSVENSGTGQIEIKEANSVYIENSGIGIVHILKAKDIIKNENSGIGKITINQ